MTDQAVPPATIVSQRGEAAVIALAGEIDMVTVPDVRRCITQCTAGGYIDITLDMSDLSFMDSGGVAVIAATIKELNRRGGRLALRNPTPIVKRVLEISRLAGLLEIEESTGSTSSPQGSPSPPDSQ